MLGKALRGIGGAAVLAVALVLSPQPTVGVAPAAAQESSGGLLRFLFGNNDQQRVQQSQPPAAVQPRRSTQRRSTQQRSSAPAAPQPAAVEKTDDARKVLVVGDFVAGGLGEGLETAFAEKPNVVVVTRANGSSGLVRQDYYDWPGTIGGLVDEVRPTVVVVMVGANDRQQMTVAGQREEPRSEAFMAEYERRAARLAQEVRDRGAQLVWVGTVPFRFRAMSSDMLAFNDIYRRAVENAGGEFVDVWDGFVDEEGAFAASGPDMNGQPAQLRASDGINLTRAGKRKLAFYVEKPLNRIIGEGQPATASLQPGEVRVEDGAPLEGAVDRGLIEALDAAAAPRIERTAPIGLDDATLFGSRELLGARERVAAAEAPADALAPEARPGRADNFSVRRR